MKIGEAKPWKFRPELTEGSVIECPGCGGWSPLRGWSVGRGKSGPSIVCPQCDAKFGKAGGQIFETRSK